MIAIKTAEQIEGIRESCKLAARTLTHLEQFIVQGVSTSELNDRAAEYIKQHGAIPACLNYNGFPKEVCISTNEVICHGVPNDRILTEGDIVNIDVTTILNGYYGDTCKTYPVGRIRKPARKILKASEDALFIGINQVKPGNHIGDIGSAIHKFAKSMGFSVVYQFCGHGTGLEFHEEPQIPHMAAKGSGARMEPGMIFTIEPMLNEGKAEAVIDESDGWTARTIDGKLSAQFEHTILVTEKGHEILTII